MYSAQRHCGAAVGSVWSCLVWNGSEIHLILLCLELGFSQETTRSSALIFSQIRLWKTCHVVEFYFSKLHSLYPKRSCLILKPRHSKACWASLIYFLYIWFDKTNSLMLYNCFLWDFILESELTFSSEFIKVSHTHGCTLNTTWIKQ